MTALKAKAPNREVPNQSYARIRKNVLSQQKGDNSVSEGDLFIDPSFPPDLSSLTYVYSGDDRYEKMVFKRPLTITPDAVCSGVGGVPDASFPWKQFRKRKWFEAAVVITSLFVRYTERLIPGYRTCEQSFSVDYIVHDSSFSANHSLKNWAQALEKYAQAIEKLYNFRRNRRLTFAGAFHFNIWRFGEWVDVVVDDSIPTIDDKLIYCQAFGNPPEYWGPLLEKAYAKIMQTYEAIECGNTLDALTDVTGAICEFYTPDINPPEHFFHLIYKSWSNRSYMVCWRNDKRLTHTGFHHCKYHSGKNNDELEAKENDGRYLHIITAVTKFPTTDSRLIEMVRLKCPYTSEPSWKGKFSDSDDLSWDSINSGFLDRYRPRTCKEPDEYWLSMEDFRCNFGGLIICSSKEHFRLEGFNVDRVYACAKEPDMFVNNNTSKGIYSRHPTPAMFCSSRREKGRESKNDSSKIALPYPRESSSEISVRENKRTIKMDTTKSDWLPRNRVNVCVDSADDDSIIKFLLQRRRRSEIPSGSKGNGNKTFVRSRSSSQTSTRLDQAMHERLQKTLESTMSINSNISDPESVYSMTDISVHLADTSRNNSLCKGNRNASLPATATIGRKPSTGSVSHLTQSNFLAMKTDCFRSHGSWKQIIDHHDIWTKQMTGCMKEDENAYSSNPRIQFAINSRTARTSSDNDLSSPPFHGKSHVLISLLQDCRHGPSTVNSLLVPIGLWVYKTKSSDKDEKRPLSKLHLISRFESAHDHREVSGRLDLEEGNYVIVPYCMVRRHEGRFLLRMLGDKESVISKSGCFVS